MYTSPYQPGFNKATARKVGMDVGRSALEKAVIYGYEGMKFLVKFIQDAIRQVIGR